MLEAWLEKRIQPQGAALDERSRSAWGKAASVMGIGGNALLFAGKIAVGLVSGSVAITADAFNNLSDASSSIVSLLGFKMADKPADAEHPYGHGRYEYLSALMVAVMILVIGVELMKGSVEKILHPTPVAFSWPLMLVLVCSIAVKLWMSAFNRRIGRRIGSKTLMATADDSRNDVIATSVVLLATVAGHLTGFMLDGWLGAAVAAFILFSGFMLVKETIDPLLGQPPEPELVHEIEKTVMAYDPIQSIHDMIIHDYGPGRLMISLHAEVPADGDLVAMHDVIDLVEQKLRDTFHCDAVIHMDPIVTDDAETLRMRSKMNQLVQVIDSRVTVHDFRMVTGPSHTNLIFDVAAPYDVKMTDGEIKRQVEQIVALLDGHYNAVVTVDRIYT